MFPSKVFKIQESLFNVDFQMYNIITLAMGYFVDKHDRSPRKNVKAKKFWLFVKSLKNDAFGINTLRENGILKTDNS